MNNFHIVIPARYQSQRLPGKPLLELAGRSLLEHVHRCAMLAGCTSVVIATDDDRIAAAARDFGADVCMTSVAHQSGTDRIAEVAQERGWGADEIVVNLQGDEPLMPVALLRQVAGNLADVEAASIATLCTPLTERDSQLDPSNVKVVRDVNKMALYFSRSLVPHTRDEGESDTGVYRHVGLYAYRVSYLSSFSELQAAPIELDEKLEQLRAMWYGYRIHVDDAIEAPGPDVNTIDDLRRVERELM